MELRFQTKILLVFVVIVFVPITAILVTIGIKSEDEIQDSHINYMIQLNEQINHTMDTIINDAERVSLMHISDHKMAEVFDERIQAKALTHYILH